MSNLRIIPRSDKENEWISENPILRKYEFVVSLCEDGEFRYKVGDGETAYIDLPFVSLAYGLRNGLFYADCGNIQMIKIDIYGHEKVDDIAEEKDV